MILYGIVLVAHNGFKFDFPILMAEVERRPESLELASFSRHKIHFVDTYPLVQKVKYSVIDLYYVYHHTQL